MGRKKQRTGKKSQEDPQHSQQVYFHIQKRQNGGRKITETKADEMKLSGNWNIFRLKEQNFSLTSGKLT